MSSWLHRDVWQSENYSRLDINVRLTEISLVTQAMRLLYKISMEDECVEKEERQSL